MWRSIAASICRCCAFSPLRDGRRSPSAEHCRAGVCAPPGCRRRRRYPSDASDAEWALLAPLLPGPGLPGHSGRAPWGELPRCGGGCDPACGS